jgi:dsDNA-binding SOS-regulon protein
MPKFTTYDQVKRIMLPSQESLDGKVPFSRDYVPFSRVCRVKRCYVSMFSAEQSLVENFSMPKSRGAGDFSIQFHCFAWNPETLVAEGFLDFNEKVYTSAIHNRLVELGARSIEVKTFKQNNNHSAASALNRVMSVAKTEGFTEVARGSCNSKLADKAEELRKLEKKPATEFDEKTQAALKMSLGEIKDSMATKESALIADADQQPQPNETAALNESIVATELGYRKCSYVDLINKLIVERGFSHK